MYGGWLYEYTDDLSGHYTALGCSTHTCATTNTCRQFAVSFFIGCFTRLVSPMTGILVNVLGKTEMIAVSCFSIEENKKNIPQHCVCKVGLDFFNPFHLETHLRTQWSHQLFLLIFINIKIIIATTIPIA